MEISVYLACTDGGSVMGAFRTRDGALKCLIENALFDMEGDRWTDEERASVISHLEEDGSAGGFGYIEYVGELGE